MAGGAIEWQWVSFNGRSCHCNGSSSDSAAQFADSPIKNWPSRTVALRNRLPLPLLSGISRYRR